MLASRDGLKNENALNHRANFTKHSRSLFKRGAMTKLHFHDFEPTTEVTAEKWWALRNIHVLQAWHIAQEKGRGETIVLFGQDCLQHDELEGDALVSFSTQVDSFDGTCAATIAVSRQQGEIAGSAPAAQIMATQNEETALQAVAEGAGIVVLAKPVSSKLVHVAKQHGAILLSPAGDDERGIDEETGPIIVAGSTYDDYFWKKSNAGNAVDFAAPACEVWGGSMADDCTVTQVSGTFAAVSLVAGVAALWRSHFTHAALVDLASRNNTTIHEMFKRAVVGTARCPNHWDEENQGAGIIDAEALLRLPLDRLH